MFFSGTAFLISQCALVSDGFRMESFNGRTKPDQIYGETAVPGKTFRPAIYGIWKISRTPAGGPIVPIFPGGPYWASNYNT